MKFEYSDEQQMVRDMVRDFARNEIAPSAEERDRTGEFPTEIIRKAAELGLCGIAVPEELGGAGFDTVSEELAVIELASVCASTAITLSVNNCVFCWPLQTFGNSEQKERFLKPAARGEFLGAFCLTEPNAGSDVSNLSVKAVEDGDFFVIEGTKAWVTNGAVAGAFIVMAVTGEGEKRKEISAFVIPADLPGISVGKEEQKMGLHSSNTVQIVFEGCRVPKELMLGKRGDGLKIALSTLDQSRISVAAQAIGIASGAFAEALRYSKERQTFGKPIAQHQAIGSMLADMATEIESATLMTMRAAWMLDHKLPFTREASMAKYYASEAAKRVCDRAVQIHGSYGYSKEYAVERYFRDVRVTTIYEGSSEIQKIIIARDMLK
ncbi:MAG TPA: acyl-CoA dehydrogenase family protein [Acidobacteriota bacterium]|nr:acyl-CoA dehydrogenase family protein [Acidobacteriota bacterium]